MAQPIQAVQIYYEHPFGAEREVLREFFSFVGCLVKTTMMQLEELGTETFVITACVVAEKSLLLIVLLCCKEK